MDPTRDNAFKRFSAFWIALGMMILFGIACHLLRPMTQAKRDTAYMMKEEERLQTKESIEKTQVLDTKRVNQNIEQLSTSLGAAPTPGAMAIPQ